MCKCSGSVDERAVSWSETSCQDNIQGNVLFSCTWNNCRVLAPLISSALSKHFSRPFDGIKSSPEGT